MQTAHHPRVLDVTLRDGGYVIGHSWTPEAALRIIGVVAHANIPAIEIGYFRPRRHDIDGALLPAASCPGDYIALLHSVAGGVSLAVMVHQADVRLDDYRMLAQHGVDMVRLPTRTSSTGRVRDHIAAIHDNGMTATVNLLRVSEPARSEVASAAAAAHLADADVVYLADSNGSLFPSHVTEIVEIVRDQTDRPIGFHAHDGLSLAFINSLAAVEAGCTYLDASLGGLGKGGGNLAVELICAYLRTRLGSPIDVPSLATAANEVLATWGGGAAAARCESIASGLLNLNTDDIARLRAERAGGVLTLLDRDAEQDGAARLVNRLTAD